MYTNFIVGEINFSMNFLTWCKESRNDIQQA